MKWGVRRYQNYDGTLTELGKQHYANKDNSTEVNPETDVTRNVITGHKDAPRDGTPNSITDHVYGDGKVHVRTHYGTDGQKDWEIHTDDHGKPKSHPYGEHGEHHHDYTWDEEGKLKDKTVRDLTDEEREENKDIL